MAYGVYMDGLLLPVTPSKIKIKMNGNNKTMTLINGEEINIIKSMKLSEISFDMLLPNVKYPFAVYPDEFHDAKYYIFFLEKLKKRSKAFPFLITRELPSGKLLYDTMEMPVTLEDYTITDDVNDGFDVMVSVNLKQYRDYGTDTSKVIFEITKNNTRDLFSAPKAERAANKETPKGYTVVKGDTLWTICKMQLGDGSKCWDIAKLNGIPDPNKIASGQVIRFE